MELKVSNLGPIREAHIDISKRLTVFCGPNNSGKTYVAFLIYAITKAGMRINNSKKNKDLLQIILNDKSKKYEPKIDDIWNYRNRELKLIKKSIDSLFGISSELVDNLFKDFDISINQTKKEFRQSIENMRFNSKIKINNIDITVVKNIGVNYVELNLGSGNFSEKDLDFIELFLSSKIYSLLAFYPFSTSHILPVERNSIYTFSKDLSIQKQELLDKAQDFASNTKKNPLNWLMKRSTRYSLPIKDGLEIAEDLSTTSKLKSDFFEIAIEIEKELLGGKTTISKDGEVLFSPLKSKRKKIPIQLSASIVKTLSSLFFYLKHIANKNDLIIIDEPELNLHPNNQVLLARLFAKLINLGFRLLVSTHSDYIIRELNNLIMLSNKNVQTKNINEELGYSKSDQIAQDQIAAYLFDYKKANSKYVDVTRVPITETGFDIKTIDETIDKLNDTTEKLFYSIKFDEADD